MQLNATAMAGLQFWIMSEMPGEKGGAFE